MFDIGDRIHLLFLSPFFREREQIRYNAKKKGIKDT